jgi:hypothetical protein
MQDQKVSLALEVSRAALFQNFDYFGFPEIPPDAINEGSSMLQAANYIRSAKKSHQSHVSGLEREKRYSALAYECFEAYSRTNSFSVEILANRVDAFKCLANGGLDKKMLQKWFSKYGLEYVSHRQSQGCRNVVDLGSIRYMLVTLKAATNFSDPQSS